MKNIIISLLCLIINYATANANEIRQKAEAELFTARIPLEFEAAIATASKLGINKQVILEATFLYYVDTENYTAIAALHTQFQNQLKEFDLDTSKIFATKEQWQSVIQYSLALKALLNNDETNFKKHITEAYWLSPETASAFSHHITKLRNKKIMQKITIKPEREMHTLNDTKNITFKEIIKDHDAIVLRFWSPWNVQLDKTLPLIQSAAEQCKKGKITFASVLLENDETLIKNAKEIITQTKPELPSLWLIDSNIKSLSKELRISNLPTLVIITKEGKVIYHGSASNNSFWKTLSTIDPNIKKPKLIQQQ